MSSEPDDPQEAAEPPSISHKRHASLTAAAADELARKRVRFATDDDVVLVSRECVHPLRAPPVSCSS